MLHAHFSLVKYSLSEISYDYVSYVVVISFPLLFSVKFLIIKCYVYVVTLMADFHQMIVIVDNYNQVRQ